MFKKDTLRDLGTKPTTGIKKTTDLTIEEALEIEEGNRNGPGRVVVDGDKHKVTVIRPPIRQPRTPRAN